jgi:hypothetical protein
MDRIPTEGLEVTHVKTKLPVYCGANGEVEFGIEREICGTVRFSTPHGQDVTPTHCFHIDDPKAAATLIEYLQPLAGKAPKPRTVTKLGDSEKDAVWKLSDAYPSQSARRWMHSAQGWLHSWNGTEWHASTSDDREARNGFVEVLG